MNLREQITHIVEQLPENRLEEVLRMMQLLSSEDAEIEAIWLPTSGILKQMVDTLDEAPPVLDDFAVGRK